VHAFGDFASRTLFKISSGQDRHFPRPAKEFHPLSKISRSSITTSTLGHPILHRRRCQTTYTVFAKVIYYKSRFYIIKIAPISLAHLGLRNFASALEWVKSYNNASVPRQTTTVGDFIKSFIIIISRSAARYSTFYFLMLVTKRPQICGRDLAKPKRFGAA
jgi:hypothetical protein